MIAIKTRQNNTPWLWIVLLGFPAAMAAFVDKCSETALTFTMKKFTDDPVTISVLGSMNILFGLTIAPLVAYYSDRHINSRKPFMIAGLLLAAVSMVFIPYAGSLFWLALIVIIFFAAIDFGFTGLWDPLYADLVPDNRRGRGMVINRYLAMSARLLFMFFLIGKFSEHIGQPKLVKAFTGANAINLTGEQMIYFIAALFIVIAAVIIGLFIRENDIIPQRSVARLNIKDFFREIFGVSENRTLFLLMAASALMSVKLKNLMPLLFTDQFGFSMQTMGQVHGSTMLVNCLFVLPLAALVADRLNRYWLFMICLFGSTLQPILFWGYVKYIDIPTPAIAIAFHVADAGFDHLALISLWPLLYERVVSGKRGSLKAGLLIVGGLTSFIVSIILGVWIKWFSSNVAEHGYDYMSGYLLIFLSGVIACVLAVMAGFRLKSYEVK